MIITKTPLRISFVGGGSDLPAYTDGPRGEVGAVVSAAIDLHIYVAVHQHFSHRTRVAYSRIEDVPHPSYLKHDIARECMKHLLPDQGEAGFEITSVADVPYGTGLGSSSSYAVGLVHALRVITGKTTEAHQLATDACAIEIEACDKPVGRQDQFAAAYGGLNLFEFARGMGGVVRQPIIMTSQHLEELQNNLMLLWTGRTREASDHLKVQAPRIAEDSRDRASVRSMANLAYELRDRLKDGDIHAVGYIMSAAWALKKSLPGVADDQINYWCQLAREAIPNGRPFGIKLLGAGGGGCLLVYAPRMYHMDILSAVSLRQIPFQFSRTGSELIHQ